MEENKFDKEINKIWNEEVKASSDRQVWARLSRALLRLKHYLHKEIDDFIDGYVEAIEEKRGENG